MKIIDKDELKRAIEFISKLAEGIEPISGAKLPEDTILNNRVYLRMFSHIDEMLCHLLRNFNRVSKNADEDRMNFHLPDSEFENIKISKEPISISEIAYNINAIANKFNTKKVKAIEITAWLEEEGYLQEDRTGKTTHKICTAKAAEIGVRTVIKENSRKKEYYVNLYSDVAQKFIIENIESIL